MAERARLNHSAAHSAPAPAQRKAVPVASHAAVVQGKSSDPGAMQRLQAAAGNAALQRLVAQRQAPEEEELMA